MLVTVFADDRLRRQQFSVHCPKELDGVRYADVIINLLASLLDQGVVPGEASLKMLPEAEAVQLSIPNQRGSAVRHYLLREDTAGHLTSTFLSITLHS